ncbi:MAG: hypothetical protein Q4A01_11405 [Coriobacteriales bacterium]|nr:hypothetical protein [Coriobacteriales bacterium]
MRRQTVLFGLTVCVSVALAACGAQTSDRQETPASNTPPAEQTQSEPSPNPEAEKRLEDIPESDPADSGTKPVEPTGMEVVDQLQGWWVDASDASQGLPAYVFEGSLFYVVQGNGRDEGQTHTITEADVTRGEEDGVTGWRVSLGDQALFVPESDPQSPVLISPDAHIILARGEGDLY